MQEQKVVYRQEAPTVSIFPLWATAVNKLNLGRWI